MRCQVEGCVAHGVADNLCEKHYRRFRHHGHFNQTRPSDWGQRRKHPLYNSWRWIRKRTVNGACPEWDNFWQFVKDVGEKPSPKHTLRRIDDSKPWSAKNYFWKERLHSSKDKNAYAKEWRKKNPEACKASDLKRMYGISIDDYHSILERQEGGCAICKKQQNGNFKFLSVDHCHNTNQIRGLLCNDCNRAIGLLADSSELCKTASEYLSHYRSLKNGS